MSWVGRGEGEGARGEKGVPRGTDAAKTAPLVWATHHLVDGHRGGLFVVVVGDGAAHGEAAALAQIASDDMDNECARLPQRLGADWRCVVGHRAPGRNAARGEGGGAPARPDSLVWMDVALAAWRGRVEGRKGKQERTDMQRQVTAWLKAGYVKLPRGVTACMCAKKVINILDHPKNAPQIRSYVSLSLLLSVSLSRARALSLSFSLSLSLSICVSRIPAPRDTSSPLSLSLWLLARVRAYF